MTTLSTKYSTCIDYFLSINPHPTTELNFSSPFELLVAVILSAQCTDKRVNQITPELFAAYSNPEKMAMSDSSEIYEYIKSCSYPNNKAKHLHAMAQALVERFHSQIPESMDNLQSLPGVGRKTANVIANTLFEAPTIAVDTHVFRVANRIGLVKNAKTPLETEKQLIKSTPQEHIQTMHHWLILHGRYTCIARKPKCAECGLGKVCDFFKENG
ncbi:MAG: endonuclease III [Bacteroidales bacterium]|jgi:endonuclease-3|nr:endonuclease III [Bacteroidales bacterium]